MEEKNKLMWVLDIGYRAYRPVWEFQRQLQQERIQNRIPDTLILVEHPPVYTIGKNGSAQNVIATPQFLQQQGIEVIHVDRGGDVTYHGPGQLVGYPIFNLHQHRESVSWYMRQLEEVFIRALRHWHIAAERKQGYPGVWIGEEKIVALGVRISHWVTMHGFALNVCPNLSHFQGIIPCGLAHKGVTSMEKELKRKVTLSEVKPVVVEKFREVFDFREVEFVHKLPHQFEHSSIEEV